MLLAEGPTCKKVSKCRVTPENPRSLSSFVGLNRYRSQGRSQVSHKAAAAIRRGLNSQATGQWNRTQGWEAS